MTEHYKHAPEQIWLQVNGDAGPSDWDKPIDLEVDEVTWCKDEVFDCDVEYIRADLAAERERELVNALEAASNCLQGEINPSNYDHDDVCWLNANCIGAASIIDDALAKHKEQSGG